MSNRWPLGWSFRRFYGFLGGETNQYYPDLTYDNRHIEPPYTGSPSVGHCTHEFANQK